MKSFVVLLVLLGCTYGNDDIVNWDSIYKGDTEIPKNEKTANEKDWKVSDKDGDLNIQWYGQESDPSVQLAFDQKGVLAGVRLTIPTGNKDDFYKNSKVFEQKTISGKAYYTSTVILTDSDILTKSGGRRTTEDDEIAEKVLFKQKDGTYEEVQRDACTNAQRGVFVEQGCKKGYGLVFSPLKKEENSCSYPFFLVYNEKQNVGELLAFGWLVPATNIKNTKALTKKDRQTLFPAAPNCVTGLTPVIIWLAKDESKQANCDEPIGHFIKNRCQPKRRGGGNL